MELARKTLIIIQENIGEGGRVKNENTKNSELLKLFGIHLLV